MPIYEYQCDGCQEVFEVRQRMTDPAPASHACGSTALHRVLSPTSFVLKGTGWYATDYGNRSQPPPEGGEGAGNKTAKAGASGGEASSGAATGGKPEAGQISTAGKSAAAPSAAPSAEAKAGAKASAPSGPKGGGSPAAA